MQLTPTRYRAVTIGALVALAVIVVTGTAVRLTGSGLGCDDWPNCNSERLIDVSDSHAAIEQLNRLFTGIVAVAVIAAVLGSLVRIGERRRDLTWLSLGLVAGVLGQIVLGGITVLVDLHPVAVQGHFLLSMVLIANATVLVRRAGEPDGSMRRRVVMTPAQALAWIVAALTTVALFTGTIVTGAGPHAGDEDVQRFGVDIAAAARVHGITVMSAIATGVALAWVIGRSRGDRRALRGALSTWLFVAAMQAAIGYVQYFNDVPELLVAAHVTGATVLFVVTVQLVLDTSTVDADADAPAERSAGEMLARATPRD